MAVHRVTRGLTIPLAGEPDPVVEGLRPVSRVGLVGDDYVGLRPTFHVGVGDRVRVGQLLFEDKAQPGVRYTAPAAGSVAAIHRGERRVFESLVIDVPPAERSRRSAHVTFTSFTGRHPSAIPEDGVRALLLESGLWTALRARPFSRVADPGARPAAIFVTAIDTDPLAPDADPLIRERHADFTRGLTALVRLTDGPVFVCTSTAFPVALPAGDRVRHEQFAGPHPAGAVGFHIHRLYPAGRSRVVWHVGYQDVIAVGHLFDTGRLDSARVIALSGPAMARPRLVRTGVGAAIDDLIRDELRDGEVRIISGSALSGRAVRGPVHGYLGRYHRQVCALSEGREREFFGWAAAGLRKFSAAGVFVSRLLPRRRFALSTTTNGSRRAIVPIGVYDRALPFDMPSTVLLKALLTGDTERAEQLGCLELDEEDLALCTFVCPGKNDYGTPLRQVLTALEQEA